MGIKCGIGVKKQVGNLQLGLNAAWLPSFNKMYSTKIEGLHMKDRTFSIGVSLGYMLHTSKSESLYSVKNIESVTNRNKKFVPVYPTGNTGTNLKNIFIPKPIFSLVGIYGLLSSGLMRN